MERYFKGLFQNALARPLLPILPWNSFIVLADMMRRTRPKTEVAGIVSENWGISVEVDIELGVSKVSFFYAGPMMLDRAIRGDKIR